MPPQAPAVAAAPSATAPVMASRPRPDRSQLPKPGDLGTWSAPEPQIFKLSNGLPVYHLEEDTAPLATLMLVLPRGAATDPAGKSGLTALTVDLLDEGTASMNALELNDALQILATDYHASAGIHQVVLSMQLLSEQFAPSAQLLSDIARKPQFAQQEFARRKAQRVAEALAAEADPTHAREVVVHRALFGSGYAGSRPSGTRDSLEALRLADVKRQYKALFAPDQAALIVVGNLDATKAQTALESAFGDWKGTATAKPAALETELPKAGIYLIDYPGSTQSSIAVARRAPGEKAPNYFPAMLFSRALGESFTSRLNLNLREDKGYTYGAASSFDRWHDAGLFEIRANVKSEVTRESLNEIFRELRQVAGERRISAVEHREAIEGLLLGYPGRFEHMSGVARQFASLPLYQRDRDWYSRWPERVAAQSLESVQQVAERSAQLGDYVVVIAGDRKQLVPTLHGLGLPIQVFDAQGNPVKE